MLVSDLYAECALHTHDVAYAELSTSNWISFIASAARDMRSSGWLIRLEDDESLSATSNQYEYDVPASFAYIETLYLEESINGTSVYTHQMPRAHWEIRLNGGAPTIYFLSLNELVPDKHIKIIGQKRPTIYTSGSETIDPGAESFLRERALYFGFRFLGAGLSELARWRQAMSSQCFVTSETMLRRHPQEFRALPSAVEIPGRG